MGLLDTGRRCGIHPVVAVLGWTVACGGEEAPADAVYVRLRNDTEYSFDEVSMLITGQSSTHSFGALPAGEHSDYQKVEGIYGFEGGFADAGDLQFCGTVIDHVGDELVGFGRYTYDVDVELGTGCLPDFDGWLSLQQL